MVYFDNEDDDASVTSTPATAVPAVDEILPPLTDLAHDIDHVERIANRNGQKRILCSWYDKDFPDNITKSLWNLCEMKGGGIKLCGANIPSNHHRRYLDLYDKKVGVKNKQVGKCC